MFEIHKSIVVDENQKPIAVQIPFDEFQRIEEVIENYGLAKLMVEAEDGERLSVDSAKAYYESLKINDVAGWIYTHRTSKFGLYNHSSGFLPVGEGIAAEFWSAISMYLTQRGIEIIVLLAGGNKGTQEKDIKTALELARKL